MRSAVLPESGAERPFPDSWDGRDSAGYLYITPALPDKGLYMGISAYLGCLPIKMVSAVFGDRRTADICSRRFD